MNFTKEEVYSQLDKITLNKIFSRSKINVRLLKFLVESTLEGDDLKEMTIGVEFFGSKYDPVKYDNKVRVYVYHLRKKLEEYYSTEAATDEIVFKIAKGQYKVQFDYYRKEKKESASKYRWEYTAVLIALIAIAVAYLLPPMPNAFWKTLMKNEYSTTVIFGDYFTMRAPLPTGNVGMIRDYNINSMLDFEAYLENHPEHKDILVQTPQHYFNWVAPFCSRSITEFFYSHDYPFDIEQISKWSVSQLEKENLVYFGQSKTMGVLRKILTENFPQYEFKIEKLERTELQNGKKTLYADVVSYEEKLTDYTVVSKITMPTGNEIRFFLSDQDIGAINAIQYFTNADSVKAFYERHELTEDTDFLALFKVTGWQRKTYDMEFLVLDKKE